MVVKCGRGERAHELCRLHQRIGVGIERRFHECTTLHQLPVYLILVSNLHDRVWVFCLPIRLSPHLLIRLMHQLLLQMLLASAFACTSFRSRCINNWS
jgi:hypothetical protein